MWVGDYFWLVGVYGVLFWVGRGGWRRVVMDEALFWVGRGWENILGGWG